MTTNPIIQEQPALKVDRQSMDVDIV